MDNELTITTPVEELEQKLAEETSTEGIKDIIDIFNLNIQKKNIVRATKLNDIQDKITAQIEDRINKHSDEFSNKDLLDYFKTIQDTVDKNSISSSDIVSPQINVVNTINLESDKLSRESKERVADAIKAILNSTSSIVDAEIIEETKDDNK